MRRRLLLGSIGLLIPGAQAATRTTSRPSVRHRLTWPQLQALAGRRLGDEKPSGPLHADLRRLLDDRYPRFLIGLGDEVPMRRIGDAILGEGVKPGTLGYEASLFVLGRDGAMFVVLKRGDFGADVDRIGDDAPLRDWDVKHRALEFMDLDE